MFCINLQYSLVLIIMFQINFDSICSGFQSCLNYILANKYMLSSADDSRLNESQKFPRGVRDVMREILRQKDQVIQQLNLQLKTMQSQIKEVADRIESNNFPNLSQFNLSNLRSNGFILQNQEKHLIVVDLSALVKQNRTIFQMDSKLIILKEQGYDKYYDQTEQLNRNYHHLMEQFSKLQKFIISKSVDNKSNQPSQREEIATTEVKIINQAERNGIEKEINSNEQFDKIVEQNEMLKMQLEQLKNQIQNHRHFSEKKHYVQTSSFKDSQFFQKTQNLMNQLKELKAVNQRLAIENNDLNKIRSDLVRQNHFLIEESKKQQFQNQQIQHIVPHQQQNEKNQSFILNEQKCLIKEHQQNGLVLNQIKDQKMQKVQYTSYKNNTIEQHPEAQNINGISSINFQLVSPISFPQASTNHKEKQKKHKAKRIIRLGY